MVKRKWKKCNFKEANQGRPIAGLRVEIKVDTENSTKEMGKFSQEGLLEGPMSVEWLSEQPDPGNWD